jgi:hypothetical protein
MHVSRGLGAAGRWARPAVCGVLLAAMVLAPAVAAADPKWNRIDTPNFVVIGTGSDKSLTDVGLQFEGFREALSRLVSPTATATAVPTIVIVFPNDKTLEPFRPVFNGKRVEIGGLFLPRQDVNFVLLAPHQTDDSWRVVFHEYSHLIVNNVAPNLPPWLNEGLAEYYSSFEIRGSGRQVELGKPIAAHYRELAVQPWLSIDELIDTTHDSPRYNEGARRDIFYAQSWLLTHMLLHGQPNRTAKLSAYVDAILSNMTPHQAWEKVFAGDAIDKALRVYAARPLVASLYTLSERIARASGQHADLTPAGAEALFGELALAVGDKESALARFKKALALDPALPLAAIGAAEAGGEDLPAKPLAPSNDWLDDYLVAAATVRGRSSAAAASAGVVALLEHAAGVHPVGNMFGLIAEVAGDDGTLNAADIDGLRRAHESAPARDDYAFELARALTTSGKYPEARNVLGALIAHPHWQSSRDSALRMMRWVVDREQRAAEPAATPASEPEPVTADTPPVPDTTTEPAETNPEKKEPEVEPFYREVQPGEERAEGLLERVDCDPGKPAIVTVRYPHRVARYQAERLTDIDFITYDSAKGGRFSCGPRVPPARIYLTWKKANGVDRVVAVEFLPRKR